MIDKPTKTDFESFSEEYPDLSQLVKDARTKTVNLTKQLDVLNTAPQPVFRPEADLGVNSGNAKSENLKKQIHDTKTELKKQVDQRTSYYPSEIKQDIQDKIDYLTNPDNKELDQKESKDSFEYMGDLHFQAKAKSENADREYKERAMERSSDRFNALLVSYREDGNQSKEPEIDKSNQKNDIKDYPKSSDYYNQSLNYKIEPLESQEPGVPNQEKEKTEKEKLSKDEIEDKDLKKENDNGDKKTDDLSENKDEHQKPEKEDLDKEEIEEDKENTDNVENKESQAEKEWDKVDHEVEVSENTEHHTITYELQEKDGASTDVSEPIIEDSEPEPDRD